MKKLIALVLLLSLLSVCPAWAEAFDYRFVGAEEAAELLLDNRDYYDGMSQGDLDFRMQKKGATLEELKAFAAAQTLDYTDDERAAIDGAMARIESACAQRGYRLPPTDGIVFAKTTSEEECGAGAYTHGTQVYMGQPLLEYGVSDDPQAQSEIDFCVAHELFHCLTRNHPDFRAAMYGILGFTVAESDFDIADDICEAMISNPDVEHHNAYAAFDIGGRMTDCTVEFSSGRPFEKPGDSFFDDMVTGLVPIDDLSTMYTSEDAANFQEVFGENTDYVIDPEETLADNFAMALLYGPDGQSYPSPWIIQAIDAYLKSAP